MPSQSHTAAVVIQARRRLAPGVLPILPLQQHQHRWIPEDLLPALAAAAEQQGDAPVTAGFGELPVVLVVAMKLW
jgi:hypothetical protein